MLSRVFRPMAHLSLATALSATVALSGCQSLLSGRYHDSLPPDQGIVRVQGLTQSVVYAAMR
jgi:acyl-homoserine-lactone acylase